jgi:hypothetical protein
MATLVKASDITTFLTNVAWTNHSTYHTVLKASPEAALFGLDMLFYIPFLSEWIEIGDQRHIKQISTLNMNNSHAVIGTTKVSDKLLLRKDGILCKSERSDPWAST